jgi:hypothetical protein
VLDLKRPIREADIGDDGCDVGFGPILLQKSVEADREA